MSFSSPETFAQSLRDRLRRQAGARNPAQAQRLSKLVAYARLLDRLTAIHPRGWVVKGGVALDLRLGDAARFTRDLDLAFDTEVEVDEILLSAAEHDSGDFFRYEIARTRTMESHGSITTSRYAVRVFVGDQIWDKLVVDVGVGDLVPSNPDLVPLPPTLEFAGITVSAAPLISADQHVAEKLHAYTQTYRHDQINSRVKDLVDLVLLGRHMPFAEEQLRRAIHSLFDKRATHPVPRAVPPVPASWAHSYAELARPVGLPDQVSDGYAFVSHFLGLVLAQIEDSPRYWDPRTACWHSNPER